MAETHWIGNAITAISTISASALTFLGTYFMSKNNNKRELDKLHKNIEWEREKIELEIERKERLDKLKIYNKILKTDGETIIQTSYPVEFHFKNYKEKIRPLLYEEFHLLDQNIKDIVRDIDSTISLCDFLGEVQKEEDKILELYNDLIKNINNHYTDIYNE
ncbi:hypothetical protein [Paenibacillus alvei]|uniref:hypothetical protein n=1 Tax=Paenibacillus alvei TaxID=44250 RepID=UPI00228061DB|nr:hypothetical protein [Paenibacillus alvei]